MADKLSVLVSGATGQQGGAVARMLLKKGHSVRAFVRRPASLEARELQRLGAELAEGNFEEPSTIEDAAKGMDAVFVVATPSRPARRSRPATGSLRQTRQGPRVSRTSYIAL